MKCILPCPLISHHAFPWKVLTLAYKDASSGTMGYQYTIWLRVMLGKVDFFNFASLTFSQLAYSMLAENEN